MVVLIDSTVSATTRHSDSVPIASEVAIALVNREDATDAGRLSKPAVPGDRIMVLILPMRGRIIRGMGNFASIAGNIAANREGKRRNDGKS